MLWDGVNYFIENENITVNFIGKNNKTFWRSVTIHTENKFLSYFPTDYKNKN